LNFGFKSVYTFFEKAFIIKLNADVETGKLKFEKILKDVGALPNFKFLISNFAAKIQDQQSVNYF